MRMRYCLLSVFGLEGICGIDWHYDTLAYYQLSLFHFFVFDSGFRAYIRDNANLKCGDETYES
ncbi:hypothetical protein HanXRQr2_Chr02g0067261 [Helianthus annuus]|uniref:Uncharacterized protein n=1 Tax=Helianthus annuus TaxID=4232 RepID=A0A9K3JMU3_HELAN|nr:hypothetical protein HanXRQr2_Chr02g0067261 [Helianthus annuus]KAJ0951927.1 hypothetical protein HanPSC8_Chr02g0066111 [Helianthus annuus]